VNLYQFCGCNPVNRSDADGRSAWVYAAVGVLIVAAVVLPSQVCSPSIDTQNFSPGEGGNHPKLLLNLMGFTAYNPGDNPLIAEATKQHETSHMRQYPLRPFMPPWKQEMLAFRKTLESLRASITQLKNKTRLTDKEQKQLEEAEEYMKEITDKRLDTEEGAKKYTREIDNYEKARKSGGGGV
jgi:hypothetical protein